MLPIFQAPGLQLLHLKISTEVLAPIRWNSFPGSVLHGTLGFQLKQLSCVAPHGHCADCTLNDVCAYGTLFEPHLPKDSIRMRKYDRIPLPLRIAVFPWDGETLQKNARVMVQLVLVGRAVRHAVSLLLALWQACRDGLGRKPRGELRILNIQDGEASQVISWNDFDASQSLPIRIYTWAELIASKESKDRVIFVTPVRIMAGGRIQSHPDFRGFMSSLLRRITSLAYFWADAEIEADFAGILERADNLRVKSEFHRLPVRRYSSRQKAAMSLDGVLGRYDLPQGMNEFFPWLKIGQRVGVGKNTGMGMGAYRFE